MTKSDGLVRTKTVVDLFSGAGGMSWGFRSAGFEIVGAVDAQITKKTLRSTEYRCNRTYELNLGIRPHQLDLGTTSPGELRRALGLSKAELSVLVACPPCTGFSRKRARRDRRDVPENSLVVRVADFVRELRPELFVLENVAWAALGPYRHHLEGLLAGLSRLGYEPNVVVHDFAALGLPQRRVRTLVVAGRRGRTPPPLPKRTSRARKTVRDTIGQLSPLRIGQSSVSDEMHYCPAHDERVMARIRAVPPDGGSWRDVKHRDRIFPPSLCRSDGYYDMYGRMAWDRPAPTITRECSHPGMGRYLHPQQHRLVSVREMALLQGFPRRYVFDGSTVVKYAQIGNAVPPLVARKLAHHLGRFLDGAI